jgi:hypothetical protein
LPGTDTSRHSSEQQKEDHWEKEKEKEKEKVEEGDEQRVIPLLTPTTHRNSFDSLCSPIVR